MHNVIQIFFSFVQYFFHSNIYIPQQGQIQDFNLGRRKIFESYALQYFEERPPAHSRFLTLLGIKSR